MAQSRSRAREDWKRVKPLIYRWYLVEDRTCKDIVGELKNYEEFSRATERILKSRLKDWHFELKKIAKESYLAMQAICVHRSLAGIDSFFDASTQDYARKPLTAKMVGKEYNSRLKGARLPDFDEALKTLERAAISFGCAPPGSELPCVCSHPKCYQRTSSSTETPKSDLHYNFDDSTETSPATSTNLNDHDVDFDFLDQMQNLSLQSPNEAALLRVSRQPEQDLYDLKNRAAQWAGPYFRYSWLKEKDERTFEIEKQAGMEMLRFMLRSDPNNKFIFPCLSWMVTVLGLNGKITELKEFLAASCSIINAEMSPRGVTYGVPFNYALAHLTGDVERKSQCAALFPRAYAQIRQLYGSSHPNILVTVWFWAWHLLELGLLDDVFKLLNDFLHTSELVMGKSDPVTINCLVILARAYYGQQNHQRAVSLLETAVGRIPPERDELQMLKFLALQRLVRAKLDMNATDDAESILRQVVNGFRRHLTLDNTATWDAIEQLCDFLSTTGRDQEAAEIWAELQKELNQQRDMQWYVDGGRQIPEGLIALRARSYTV